MSLLKSGIAISKGNLIFSIYSFFYLFTFYIILTSLPNLSISTNYRLIVVAALNFEICIAILISSFFIKKINKLIFAYIIPLLIIIMSIFLFLTNWPFTLIIIFAIAPLLSIELVIFFNHFQEITLSSERARTAGIIAFVTLPFIFILTLMRQSSMNSFYSLIFIIVLNLGIIFLFFLRPNIKSINEKKEVGNYFEKKVIFFYLFPWILFSIINVTLAEDASIYILEQTSASFHLFLVALQVIGVNFGAVIAGFFADFFGRRITLALSLTLYGTSSVLVGMFTTNGAFSLMYFINGMSWGILFVLYIFVVWGDLANKDNCAKMYSFGLITYFSSLGIGLLIPRTFLPISTSSLLTCLIIFLSIIPVFLAPELISSDFIEKIRLKRHINVIKKLNKNQG
ncbi:MAG: hypothetical protein ABR909_12985 [Candidatus Bathyarchaeia archaeon]|jgi:hypothetical protein